MKYALALVLGCMALSAQGQEALRPLATYGLNSQGKRASNTTSVYLYRHVVQEVPGGFQILDEIRNDGSLLFFNHDSDLNPIEFGPGIGFIADTTKPDSLIGQYRQKLRNGLFKIQGSHLNGNRHGKWLRYHPNGIVSDSGSYEHAFPDGIWTTKDSLGKIIQIRFYNNRKLDSLHLLRENGAIAAKRVRDGANFQTICYDTNGRPNPEPCTVDQNVETLNMAELQRKLGYPMEAKQKRIQGSVIIRVLVSEEGNYQDHKIIKSPSYLLTDVVVSKLHLLKFKPLIINGKNQKVWITLPFNFYLQ